jgi:hypothetical protein
VLRQNIVFVIVADVEVKAARTELSGFNICSIIWEVKAMTDVYALHALLDRLREAAEPSKVLDAEIIRALVPNAPNIPFTSSIDAAAALCERVLPGWAPEIYFGAKPVVILEQLAKTYSSTERLVAQAKAASVPLAFCTAIVEGMIATWERTHDDRQMNRIWDMDSISG